MDVVVEKEIKIETRTVEWNDEKVVAVSIRRLIYRNGWRFCGTRDASTNNRATGLKRRVNQLIARAMYVIIISLLWVLQITRYLYYYLDFFISVMPSFSLFERLLFFVVAVVVVVAVFDDGLFLPFKAFVICCTTRTVQYICSKVNPTENTNVIQSGTKYLG